MVSDLNKNFGGSTDLAQKRLGSADLHTPIHPPPNIYFKVYINMNAKVRLHEAARFNFFKHVSDMK